MFLGCGREQREGGETDEAPPVRERTERGGVKV
jgi:hypothetical protein